MMTSSINLAATTSSPTYLSTVEEPSVLLLFRRSPLLCVHKVISEETIVGVTFWRRLKSYITVRTMYESCFKVKKRIRWWW